MISKTNGTWNRVTVRRADGTALYDASFGPGEWIPAGNMRDVEVADLDGDGRKEILAATSRGVIVAPDCQCRKGWARRLPSSPVVMKWLAAGGGDVWIVVGCEDGSVVALDGDGTAIRSARVEARFVRIAAAPAPAAPMVSLATDRGHLKGFWIGR